MFEHFVRHSPCLHSALALVHRQPVVLLIVETIKHLVLQSVEHERSDEDVFIHEIGRAHV